MLFDTSIAIPLRDGEEAIVNRAFALPVAPYFSILTVVELEGGINAKPELANARRAALDALLGRVDILPFDAQELAAYRRIIGAIGFDRRKVIDRLIAATALANGLDVVTRNPADFNDIPDLRIEVW